MKISTAYGPGQFGLSYELFPPKTETSEAAMYRHVDALMAFSPSYITCTYGAGGSTQDKTLEVASEVHRRFQLPVASHLTCVGSTRDQLAAYLRVAQERGIYNIVALRGDPPKGETSFTPVADGFRYASELVAMIHQDFPELGIAVAGYPEKHPECPTADEDLAHLKTKVQAGGDAVITQLFYENRHFFAFRDRYQAAGIEAPLIPGIMPVTNLKQIQRITSLCGADLPKSFVDELGQKDDPNWQTDVGVAFAAQQVQELIDGGVPGIHFYVLNKSLATSRVLQEVTIRAA